VLNRIGRPGAVHELGVIDKISRLRQPRQQRKLEGAFQPVVGIDAFDPMGNRLNEPVASPHRIALAAQALDRPLLAGDAEKGSLSPRVAMQRDAIGDDLADEEQPVPGRRISRGASRGRFAST